MPRMTRIKQPTDPHTAGHDPDPTVAYDLRGTVRWLDRETQRMVLHVDDAHGRGTRLVGEDLTIAIDDGTAGVDAALLADGAADALLPGASVRVKARMPRDLGMRAPDLITATRIEMA